MAWLRQDVRYAIRSMGRTPGFTLAAVATLALGLGLNASICSLAYELFIRPLPFEEAGRLVFVEQTLAGRPALGYPLSYPDYAYYRDQSSRFAALAAHYPTSPMQVVNGDSAFNASGAVVSANYFTVLRLRPALGRFFDAEEDRVPGRNPVVVISHDLWRNGFGLDPKVLGLDIRINGTAFRIIGVTPEGFRGVVRGIEPNTVFIPAAMFKVGYRYCDAAVRTCRLVGLIGRLQPDASIADAQTEMNVLASQLEAQFPETNRGRGVHVRAAQGVRIEEQTRSKSIIALLATAAVLVLLVASANVAGLLLARGLRRRKEIAIRLSLGATRARLIYQLLVESILLSTVGGAAGLIVAIWATDILRQFFGVNRSGNPLNIDLSLHPGVATIALIAAVATGVLTGVAPALQATKSDAVPALKDETAGASARRSRLRDGLIVCQVAVSVLLLAGGTLLAQSLMSVHRGPGFDPDGIVLLRLRPSLVDYDSQRSWAFQREVLRRLEALPGVVAASPADVPPLPGWRTTPQPVAREGEVIDPKHAFRVATTPVGPRYFATLGTGVIEGREFDDRDTENGPRVAILNETVARRLFPSGGAAGRRLTLGNQSVDIVGVVKDSQFLSVVDQPVPTIYLNFWQQSRTEAWNSDSRTHVRVSGNANAMLAEIRHTIAAVDPNVPVSDLQVLGDQLNYAFADVTAARALLLTFGGLALGLSAIGLYGALAFAVVQRTREIAIRVALGAARGDVSTLIFRYGLVIVGLGALIGTVAAVAMGPFLAHMLYGVSPRDPGALLVGPVALTVIALLAIWIPTRRALAVEPMLALRTE
jgi:putative ABC transport system permease protein